jgi:hypothetical protein
MHQTLTIGFSNIAGSRRIQHFSAGAASGDGPEPTGRP